MAVNADISIAKTVQEEKIDDFFRGDVRAERE